jgi:hypothetical protein
LSLIKIREPDTKARAGATKRAWQQKENAYLIELALCFSNKTRSADPTGTSCHAE